MSRSSLFAYDVIDGYENGTGAEPNVGPLYLSTS